MTFHNVSYIVRRHLTSTFQSLETIGYQARVGCIGVRIYINIEL